MRHLSLIVGMLLVGLTVLWSPQHSVRAQRVPLVVITHASTKTSSIHANALRAIFLRQTEQLAGERAIPLTYPAGTALRVDFDDRVLGMDEATVGRYWVDQRIRGLGAPPRSVSSVALLVRTVAALKGAISYAPATAIKGIPVKVLKVEGLAKPL